MVDHDAMASGMGVARVRVAGVGGAGGNAVRGMVRAQLRGVEFLAINTDAQALAQVGAPHSLRIGEKLTRGLGAGGNPEIGLRAAEESRDAIRAALGGSDMVFITAGMGGGTGTGASPAVAVTARELGALTVAIVSTPFAFEGVPRRKAAERGLAALREQVDTLIVVPNERLLRLANQSMRMSEAYALADDVLRQGVQAISDLIAVPGHINLDFADVRTVMADAGSALMSVGQASGEQRAAEALRAALANPILDVDITGARSLLVNITGGSDLMIQEVGSIVESLHQKIHADANILFGTVEDSAFEGRIKVTLVATGFEPRVSHHAPRVGAPYGGRERYPEVEDRRREVLPPPAALPESATNAGQPGDVDGLRPLPRPAAWATEPARPEDDGLDDDAATVWDAPRVARAGQDAAWSAAPAYAASPRAGTPADRPGAGIRDARDERIDERIDEPRTGQARVRPAAQAADTMPQISGNGGRGNGLPAFLQRRR